MRRAAHEIPLATIGRTTRVKAHRHKYGSAHPEANSLAPGPQILGRVRRVSSTKKALPKQRQKCGR